MIPWEVRIPFHSFYNKTVIFLLLCLCILSSHCRPIHYPGEPGIGSRTSPILNNNGNSSMVVRVIVSSSSSSSSSSAGDNKYDRDSGYFPFSSSLAVTATPTKWSSINPTTYHPELTLPPISRSVRAKTSLSGDDNIFSVFYRAFSEQGGGDKRLPIIPNRANLQVSFHAQRPNENNVSVNNNDRIVSVVSQSRSTSVSDDNSEFDNFRRLSKTPSLTTKSISISTTTSVPNVDSNQQPKAEALTQHSTDGENWQEKVWGQPEQNWGQSERVWGESARSSSEPLKMWGEPEKVWGEPEKVWGDSLKIRTEPVKATWGKQQQEKVQSADQQPPRIYEIPPGGNDEIEQSQEGRFYELGEDEEAEPQELIIKESEVKAKVEEAQLASRSWELPELNAPIVDHSLEMMAESVQVPQTHTNANSDNVPSSPRQRGKAIENEKVTPNTDVGERPGKKFGYVLDSSDVRKYRVEERTPDGYIVGEYGVINHDNGFLRGVRYTADGTINPRLIHEALMKFLAL